MLSMKEKNKYKIGFGLILFIFMLYTIVHFYNKGAFTSSSFIVGIIALFTLMVITLSCLNKVNGKRIEKQFLVIGLIWGTTFALINPPFMVPDEYVHIVRSYDLAKGRIFYKAHEDSMKLPMGIEVYDKKVWNREQGVGVVPYIKDVFNTSLEKESLRVYDAKPTSAYTMLAYIPQSVGFFIGDLLNLPPYFVIILGRLSNLSIWLALCYLALKIIPIKKELLFLLMCIPMGIQQAGSVSPDALLNSSSFLLIAYILNLKYKVNRIELRNIFIIMLLTICIGAVKLPYIAIAGLILIVPNNKFKYKLMSKVLIILLVGFVGVAGLATWKTISKPITSNNIKVEENISLNGTSEGIEIKDKNYLTDIIKKPIVFGEKVAKTLDERLEFYKTSFTANFGWFKVLAPEAFINLVLIILVAFAFKADSDNRYKLSIYDKSIFLSLGIGLYLILCATVLMWSKKPLVEIEVFDGIQGRYFYPFIMGVLLVVQNIKLKINIDNRVVDSYRNLYLTWTLMFSILFIYAQYFIFNW